MKEFVVLRLARSGVRSLPDVEAILRALLFVEIPPSELQANLDALAAAVDAVEKKHHSSGASIAEMLDDFEKLPPRCTRIVRWVQDVLRGDASAADRIELAEAIERARAPERVERSDAGVNVVTTKKEPSVDAEAILRETGSRAAFERLVKAHTSGRGITPFVGAGLSASAGYPLWRNFLLENAGRFGAEEKVSTLLGSNDYEEAAQELRNAAEVAQYRNIIESTFGAEREPKGAACLLPRITSGPVITLNYDRLIEEVYARAGMPLTPVLGAMADTFIDALHAEPSPKLLKVHGDVLEGTHRVLTADEYRSAYEAETARLPDLLRAACIARRLLFLGCSFADKRMNDILASAKGSSARHFAIMAANSNEETQRLLSSLEIEVIYYRPGQYEDVEVLLHAFIRATQSGVRVTSRVRRVLRKVADCWPAGERHPQNRGSPATRRGESGDAARTGGERRPLGRGSRPNGA